jgi:hypothetical protein
VTPPLQRSVLEELTGRRLPGGCEDCDAYQVVTRCDSDLYVLAIHHDTTCPAYQAAEGCKP